MSEIYTPEPGNYQAAPGAVGDSSKDWMAIVSLVVGVLGLCGWIIPLCGFPLAIAGVVLGVLGLKSTKKTLAIVGLVLAGLVILASLCNSILGASLALSDPSTYQNFFDSLGQ